METTYTLLFYSKKEKGYVSGPITIYARITVDGVSKEFSTGQKCEPVKWNEGNLSARTEDLRSLKYYLETLTTRVRNCHRELLETNDSVSSEMLRNRVTGKNLKPNKIIEIFKRHNKDMQALADREEIAKGTLDKYDDTLNHTRNFLQWEYSFSDMDIRKIDHEFVTQFEFYLKTVAGCSHNTSVKYVNNFGKIVRICIDNSWMKTNPFARDTSKVKKKKPIPLSEDEVIRLIEKQFRTPRLEQIRDIFIFCCFTGLAYSDVRKLSAAELFIGIDRKIWIDSDRTKTDEDAKVTLLPVKWPIIVPHSRQF